MRADAFFSTRMLHVAASFIRRCGLRELASTKASLVESLRRLTPADAAPGIVAAIGALDVRVADVTEASTAGTARVPGALPLEVMEAVLRRMDRGTLRAYACCSTGARQAALRAESLRTRCAARADG